MKKHKLVVQKGEEKNIPKYGLEQDIQYFTTESLVRMYGRKEVERFIREQKDRVSGGRG